MTTGAAAASASRLTVSRVVGRIQGPSELGGFAVTARAGGRELDRTETDLDGRFELAWPDAVELVHVAAFARWGACLGEAAVDAAKARDQLIFQAPEADLLPPAPELEEVGASPTPLLSVRSLERFYNAVSRAEQEGAFDHRFGPVEVTGWLHLTALAAYVALLVLGTGWLAGSVWISLAVGVGVFVLAAGIGKALGLMRANRQRDGLIDELHWRIATAERR